MNKINIAEKLIEKRKEMGITQETLGLHIGVSKSSVSKWEAGKNYPDIAYLPKLAAYFNITIDELMGYSSQAEEDIQASCDWFCAGWLLSTFL